MSLVIFVLSDTKLASIAEWQRAIDAAGFPLKLDTERPFENLSGHLPARWNGEPAGFECDHWDARDLVRENPTSISAANGRTRSHSGGAPN